MTNYTHGTERADYKEMQQQSVAPVTPIVDVSMVFTGAGLNDAAPGGTYTPVVTNSYTAIIDGVAAAASVGAPQFTGAGLNDAAVGLGTYTAPDDHVYTIIIDSTGATDTFKWKKDSGAFVTAVVVTGGFQPLTDGITFRLSAVTGHTLNDQWTVAGNASTDTLKWKKNAGGFTSGVRLKNNTAINIVDGVTLTFPTRLGHTLTDQWVVTIKPRARMYMDAAGVMKLVLNDGSVISV